MNPRPEGAFARSADAGWNSVALRRSMSAWNCFTLGFAVVSPVVGLYAIIGVQTQVTGGGWFAALVICLAMQLLVATVYAELASQFPIAGGAYQWARLLGGHLAGHYAGVIYVCSTLAMLTTTAYTGGIWLSILFDMTSTTGRSMVAWGLIFLLLCMAVNLVHDAAFRRVIALGVVAEVIGSLGIAILLFLFFREHSFSILFQHLGSGSAPGAVAAFFSALAIAGWAFIGFDACSTTAEETHDPKRMVPRAIFLALSAVGSVVVFNSAALTLALNPDDLAQTGAGFDPLTPLMVSNFGAWIEKPFLAVVVIAFLACGAAVVRYSSRIVFSIAREGSLPKSLCRITANGMPRNAVLFTLLLSSLGLLLGLSDEAVALIIAFGTGGLYAMFTMTTGTALFTRLAGRWDPTQGQLNLGRWGLPVNVIAFVWSSFEFINIAWPRSYFAAEGAPWWQLWAVPLVLGVILVITTLSILFNRRTQ